MRTDFIHSRPFWDTVLVALAAIGLFGFLSVLFATFSGEVSMIRFIAGMLCLCFFFVIVYGSLIEPRRILVKQKRLPLPERPGLRIGMITDIHVNKKKDIAFVEKAVEKLMALKPDVIFLGGDFVLSDTSDTYALSALSALQAPHGVFAVLGNHDTGDYITLFSRKRYKKQGQKEAVIRKLEDVGVRVLMNAQETLTLSSGKITLAGMHEIWDMPEEEAKTFLRSMNTEHPVLLLCHQPDVILHEESTNAKLIFSGHTHGGQVRLPFIGPILPLPQTLSRSFDQGTFNVGENTTLFISHGIGPTPIRSRFFATPEVVVIETTDE